MGRKSTRENKNIYQLSREASGLTREKAAGLLYLSPDRIEQIEYDKSVPHPDEILAMAKCYKAPLLYNYYCTHQCSIGKECISEVRVRDLSQITLQTLASLNALEQEKNRLIEITVDGTISPDEMNDFERIEAQLSEISQAVDSLRIWVQQAIADGRIARPAED